MPILINNLYRADLDVTVSDVDSSNEDLTQVWLENSRRKWAAFLKNVLVRMMPKASVDALSAIAEKWEYVPDGLPEEEFAARIRWQKEEALPLIHRLIEVSTGLTVNEMTKYALEEAEIKAIAVVQKVCKVLAQWKAAAFYAETVGTGDIEVYCDAEGVHKVVMPHERNDRARQYWERFLNRQEGQSFHPAFAD